MADRIPRTYDTQQTACFVIYDRRSGDILAVHHLSALPGVRSHSDRVVRKRVLMCAAEALERPTGDLRLLRTSRPITVAPGLSVDVATGTLRQSKRPRLDDEKVGGVRPRLGKA
jgi:hypothetical protein